MTREELLAQGLTEEQANAVMALHGQTVQSLNATINQHNTTITRLTGELETARNQNSNEPSNDPEPQNEELAEANRQIAQLREEINREKIKSYATEKGLTGEQADNVINAFSHDVDKATSAIDSISQIISDKETAAATAKEQELAGKATNPGGGSSENNNEKSSAEKIASKLFGGEKKENNILSHYVGGNK